MKFIHLSDLHIGKRVNEFSMLEDQKYILRVILSVIDDEKPDAVLVAGDVYDKSVPSAEAVQLLDDFLFRLAERKLPVFIISGNHDSAERLSFGGRLMDMSGIHLSPVYDGTVEPFTLSDENGNVNIYMLPFLKPVNVRRFFPENEIESYTDAIETVIGNMNVNENERNVIVAHQFVTGASRSDSEELSVGGIDDVDVTVFDAFDYVALGHIHGPQKMTRETVRYCGTPLKYSFSESNHKKSVTVVEMGAKGETQIRTIPLVPLRDMREIKGRYEDIVLKSNYEGTNTDDYIHITLTDEDDIPDVMSRLRVIYPNIMKIDYDNKRTRNTLAASIAENVEKKHPITLFGEFYETQNGQGMTDEQAEFVQSLIEEIWRGEK
ncbi:MAG: exonuclease SbcCD subunit D [Clostridia bacterium]|nr:exonuclease SbcCD subunit D [Clostridia bacterium]